MLTFFTGDLGYHEASTQFCTVAFFTEKCENYDTEYSRDYDIGGLSFQETGRQCTDENCAGDLCDAILDWEDELPEKDWLISQEQCSKINLCICLGTLLRIEPAGSLLMSAKKFVIVSLLFLLVIDDDNRELLCGPTFV